MTTRLAFTVPGAIVSDHRPKVSQFRKGKDGQQIRRDKPLTYMLKDYEAFKDRVHLYANVARRDAHWVAPAKGTKIKMYLHFYVAEKKWTHGKKMKPYLASRHVPDHGNMSKCVEDSLQDKFDKHRGLKWEGLYHDDADVITLPFPGKESWVTIVPGTEEWIDVELLVASISEKQMELEDTNTYHKKGKHR
ncbi:RusA family crossover junction endodeoxyribonuclease [Candidatus Pacearchaeota archaeon]|jgi:hypothetical protein|nr:RusA family crossover junction endodeoxyribonuclease [Candidatus Pacearchaeota archaeon]